MTRRSSKPSENRSRSSRPCRTGHVQPHTVDAGKIRSRLRWKPFRSFAKGLRETVRGTANTKRGGKRPSRAFFKNVIRCSIVASEKSHLRRTPNIRRNGLRRSPGDVCSAADRQTLMPEEVLEHSPDAV